MPSKTNKGKRSSSSPSPTDEQGTTNPWPDVPKQLLTIIARQSSLINNLSYNGGVTKSWRSVVPSPKHHSSVKLPLLPPPQLVDVTDSSTGHHVSSFDGVGEYWWYHRRDHPREYYRQHYSFHLRGYSEGALVGTKDDPSQYYMWDPITAMTWNVPNWDKDVPFKYVALSSSPFDENSSSSVIIIAVTGISKPAFVFKGLKRGSSEWVKQDSTLSDPYSSNNQLMQFTSVISFQGKFYALSLQGTLAVVEASNDSDPRITRLGKIRAVPGVQSKHFRECLITSNGELLLVFLISRKSIKVVDCVEVYRLEFDRLTWEKLHGIGDRTLFMGSNCCMSITSSSVGCRRNCVYFSQEEEGWWVFDMETQTISPGWDTINSAEKSPTWKEPDRD